MNNINQCIWDGKFKIGGEWEFNNGRNQTRAFTKKLLKYAIFSKTAKFKFVDIGCALGDGLELISHYYPNAELYGIDISKVAIDRCKKEKGHLAKFQQGSIDNINDFYDVIYVSNVLEHLIDYKSVVKKIINNCNQLLIMVPYNEMHDGKQLTPELNLDHKHTFNENSFNFMLNYMIKRYIFSCPRYWGWTFSEKITQNIKNLIRVLINRTWLCNPKQILFDINKVN